MQCIYLDNNATTPVLPGVWEAMRPYLTGVHGNPASVHQIGRQARRALDDARERIVHLLGADPEELLFTSGATESNNLALFGLCGEEGSILASPIEHPSVVEPLRQLAKRGRHVVEWLPVGRDGTLPQEAIPDSLREETRLVAIQLANHETGTLQPIDEFAKLLAERAVVHCDATQAVGKIPVDFHELGVGALALSAHKFHGPKGIGALLVRKDITLAPSLWGGHQQRGQRPGTEPVALVVGLAEALEAACREQRERHEKVTRLRQRFLDRLGEVEGVVLNGPPEGGIPHTLNLSFPGLKADVLLMNLDLAGVACSTGSACSSGSLLPSPVLQAMKVPDEVLRSAMRFSLSFLLSEAEIDEAVARIVRVVRRLRE